MEPFKGEHHDLNTSKIDIQRNIWSSLARDLPQALIYKPHPVETEIALIGGGPSIETELDKIQDMHDRGIKLIAMNGSYDWLLDHGMRPAAMVMVDAREWNARFVERYEAPCRYLIASQCHPAVFDALEGRDVTVWHVCNDVAELDILSQHYGGPENFVYVWGGSTVMLRSIGLFSALGFTRMHVFGLDCCYLQKDGTPLGHAYMQDENAYDDIMGYEIAGKDFLMSNWHAHQYQHFQDMVRDHGDCFELQVHGNGAIAWSIEQGAAALDKYAA